MIQLKKTLPFDFINPLFIKDCEELYFTKEQVKWFNENRVDFIKIADENKVEFLYNDVQISDNEESSNGIYNDKGYQCVFPRVSAYIDCPTGEVYPCDCTVHRNSNVFLLGNLYEKSFTEIWSSQARESLIELLKKDVICKGNCDCVNIFFNNEIL